MDFKEATDALFNGVDHEDLAAKLGVSVALIRQARLRSDARGHRAPPKHWPEAVVRMAEMEIMRYRQLINDVRDQMGTT